MTGSEPMPVEPENLAVDVLDTPQAGPAALRGGAMRSGAYVVGILLSLISAPLLIRHLGQVEYGHYITVIALVAIAVGLSEGGVNAVALRSYTNHSGAERTRLMANVLGVRMLLSIIGVAGAVAFAAIAGYGRDLVLGTFLVGVGVSFQVTQDLLDVSLQATLRFGRVTLAEFLRQLIGVVLVITLVIAGAHLLGFFIIAIPAGLIALLVSVRLVRGLFPLRPAFHASVVWPPAARNVVRRGRDRSEHRLFPGDRDRHVAGGDRGADGILRRLLPRCGSADRRAGAGDGGRLPDPHPRPTRRPGALRARFAAHVRARGADRRLARGSGRAWARASSSGCSRAKVAQPAVAVLRIQGLAVMFTFVAVAFAYPLLSLGRQARCCLPTPSASSPRWRRPCC